MDMTPKENEEDNIHSFKRWKTDGLINSKFYPMRHPSGKDEGKSPTTPESLLTFSSFTSYLEKSDMLRYYSSQQNKDADGTPKGLDISRLAQPEVFLQNSLEKQTPITLSESNKEISFNQEPFKYKFNLNQDQASHDLSTSENAQNPFIKMNVNMKYISLNSQPEQTQDFKQIPINVSITNNFNQRTNLKNEKNTKTQYKFSQNFKSYDKETNNKFNNFIPFAYSHESINNHKNNENNFKNLYNYQENYNNTNYENKFKENNFNRIRMPNFNEENLNYNNFENFVKNENIDHHQSYSNFYPEEDWSGITFTGNNQLHGGNNTQYLNSHIPGHFKNFNRHAYPQPSIYTNSPHIKNQMIPKFSNINYFNQNINNVQYTNQNTNAQIKKHKFENPEILNNSVNSVRDFRNNKNIRPPLIYYMNLKNEELVNHAYFLAKDQAGCRYLQKKLDEEPDIFPEIIYPKIVENLIELMNDAFGNYLIQKLLEYLPSEKIFHVLAIVKIIYSIIL